MTGVSAPSPIVNLPEPPVAIVITSDPEKVIDVLVSPSPAIESSCNAPTFVKFESLRSNVPVTSKLPSTVKLPSAVTFAPLNVNAAVAPFLIVKLPPLFVNVAKSVPESFKNTSPPPASNTISPDESKVIFVPSFVIVSRAILPTFVKFVSLRSRVPPTTKLPVMSTFSASVIFVESVELKVVPLTVIASTITLPVPLPASVTSPFVTNEVMLSLVISS